MIVFYIFFPWRLIPILKGAFRYEEKLLDSFFLYYKAVILNFQKGIADYIYFSLSFTIIVTLIRLPFLILMIQKNRDKKNGISIKKCIRITFKELVKDLPFAFIGIINLIIAPWRIISIFKIFQSQLERIPGYDKSTAIVSKRKEVKYLFIYL